MIKEIVHDHAFLQQAAEPATAADADVAQDLVDTMKSLDDCACLAANQIGVNKAVIAYEAGGRIAVMYNPKIMVGMKPYKTTEGCLSLEDTSDVRRFQTVRVSYEERVGDGLVARKRTLTGWPAQIVQHAIDHCAGKLV